MRRRFFLLGVGIVSSTLSFSQVKKQFSVENYDSVEKVDLNFKVNNGTCLIKPGENDELLNVYSNQDHDSYSHSFDKSIKKGICQIKLALEDDRSEGISRSISYRMFGTSSNTTKKIWKVYLTKNKRYDLNLTYGIGHADIDLSGLSIEKLKIYTGSADVNIGYLAGEHNPVVMDTFHVKVDLGSVNVKKLNLSKAKHVVADIGFGNLLLDFSDQPQVRSDIKGSVGAGNLMIMLPSEETPVIVKVNDSWLCRVKLTKSFKQLTDNTFVNKAYKEGADNLLTFDLDVSMGSIVFKEKK
ncbi:hypothetical protein [Fulvivirga imtechensis]|nr:hypothetical protein [Fulvivirga imtechensis]